MNKVGKFLSVFLCISLIGGLVVLNSTKSVKKISKADYSPNAFRLENCRYDSSRDSSIAVKNGKYTISRSDSLYDAENGEHGYWTFLVYLSGNADESNNGVCSGILNEIVEASKDNDKVNFVVATGGAKKWKKEKDKDPVFNMSYKKIQIYNISNGKVHEEEGQDPNDANKKYDLFPCVDKGNDKLFTASMGNPDTLQKFITYGISKYGKTTVEEPVDESTFYDEDINDTFKNDDKEATEEENKDENEEEVKTVEKTYNNHIGLILYGNDDAMGKGVAYDENCSDYLTLSELELALSASKGALKNKLDLICFDGTTSQYVEVANTLVPYAEYLVGPQCKGGYGGVRYSMIANNIKNGYTSTALEVASDMCETSFNASNEAVQKKAVLSVVDLKYLDAFLYRFNSTITKLNKMIESKPNEFIKYSKAMNQAISTSDNSVDIGNFLRKIGSKVEGITYTYSNYNLMMAHKISAVRYGTNKDATGLSMYWNMNVTDNDYKYLKNISVNPYLLNVMDASAYVTLNNDLSKYKVTRKNWEVVKDYYTNNFKFVEQGANGRIDN